MRKTALFILILTLFLGACVSQKNVPQQEAPLLATLPVTSVSSQPPIQTEILPQVTQAISVQYRKTCIERFDASFVSRGFLFYKKGDPLFSRDFYRMNLIDSQLLAIDDSVSSMPRSISPDGKRYFAYEQDENGLFLHINSFDGTEISRLKWDSSWGDVVHLSWLNADQLSVLAHSPGSTSEYQVIIFSATLSDPQILKPDMPKSLSSLAPMIYFHPDLNKAVYISGIFFVLWDAQSQDDIWQKQGVNYSLLPGGWSPDGQWFAMSIIREGSEISEIFMVDPYGQEQQLTFLAESFPSTRKVYLLQMQWSPDGKHIAYTYFLEGGDVNSRLSNLAVVDIASQTTIDYCVKLHQDGQLVWSPDGKQLAFTTLLDDGTNPFAVVLDIEDGSAKILLENAFPLGWMLSGK